MARRRVGRKVNLAAGNTAYNKAGGNKFLGAGVRSGTRKPVTSPGGSPGAVRRRGRTKPMEGPLPVVTRSRGGFTRPVRKPAFDAGVGGVKRRQSYRRGRSRV